MRIGTGPLQAGLAEKMNSPVLAIYSSALANVYFTDLNRRAHVFDVDRRAPGLLRALVDHPGIGLVVVKDGDRTLLLHNGRRVHLEDEHSDLEFLSLYDKPGLVREQLLRLAAMPSAGDLLVFGAYDGRMVVNFEDHGGAHGGIGGVQMFPFVVSPREANIDFGRVEDATELNPIFVDRYQQGARRSERMKGSSTLQSTAEDQVAAG
jgi:hypothetical protein